MPDADAPSPAPVIFVNALGQDAAAWARLRAMLGHHRTTLWSPDLSLTTRAQVTELGSRAVAAGRRAHLVGWCTGPKTMLRVAVRWPGRVASLTFLNPSFKGPRRPRESDTPYETDLEGLCRAAASNPRAAERLVAVLRAQRSTGGESQLGVPDDLRTTSAAVYDDADLLSAYAARHLEFWEDDPLADPTVHTLAVPVTVVSATDDVVVSPEDVTSVAQCLPRTRIARVDAGHFALHTHAGDVATIIEHHLAGAEGRENA
jgi:pimeloyl-ACP methyl ester carboxylesterase